MVGCAHNLIDWEQCDQDMHCLGWACRSCEYVETAEYHHQSWCRADFCGAEPVVGAVPEPAKVRS